MLTACGDNQPAENAKSSKSAESSSVATETTPATESTPSLPKKDVNYFDISGVKLGMTWDEARAAIKEDLKITDKEIIEDRFSVTRLPVSGKLVTDMFLVKKATIRSK